MDKIYTKLKNSITNTQNNSISNLYEEINKIEICNFEKCVQLFNIYVCDIDKSDEILDYIYNIIIMLGNGDPNFSNSENQTILMLASELGIDKIIIKLLKNDIDVNFKDNYKKTALLYAIERCMENTVELLLNSNAKLFPSENCSSPELFSACYNANLKITQMILNCGVNLNADSKNRENALTYALMNYKHGEEIGKFLLENGINIPAKYDLHPLLHASLVGFAEIVKILIDSGIDINIVDDEGKTALMHASKGGKDYIVELLVNKGADVNIVNKDNRTALIYGAWRSHNNQCENIVKTLLHAKANVNIKDLNNKSALSYIIGYPKKKKIVMLLLDNNANIKDASNGIFHLVQQEFCDKYEKALEYMEYLIDKGIDVNISDEDGNTLLMYACGYNRYGSYSTMITEDLKLEIVKKLLNYNANIHSKNNSGDNAVSIALQNNNYKIADYIENIIMKKIVHPDIIYI